MGKCNTVLLLVMVIVLMGASGFSYAVQIMPLADIEPGMTGVGHTVIQGTRIQQFDVEVLGVLSGADSLEEFVLVRVGGPLMNRTQGIADGMSGSPIYIDGKLVGALAYKYDRSNSYMGLVTPIENMLKIMDYDSTSNRKLMDVLDDSFIGSNGNNIHIEGNDFVPVRMPIIVSGLSNDSRVKGILESVFKDYNVGPIRVTGGGILENDIPLEPGSSVGVQLMRGHINATVLGTVTYTNDNQFLAFGHPFLHKGTSKYMASSAFIYTTIGGDSGSYKIGAPANLIGTVTQDRQSGISGVTKLYPRVLTIRVNVRCGDLQKEDEMFVQLVQEPQLIPGLLVTSLLQAIDSTIDRIGEGTASVTFEVMARGLSNKMVRNNIFYSSYDVAVACIPEILEGVDLLLNNDIKEVELIDIGIYVDIEDVRKTATILDVTIDNEKVNPGQIIKAEVSVKPFREEMFIEEIEIEVPQSFPPGYAMLSVYGGEHHMFQQLEAYYLGSLGIGNEQKEYDLETLVDAFGDRTRNNQLIIELIPYGDMFNTIPDDMELLEEHETLFPLELEEINFKGFNYGLLADNDQDLKERDEFIPFPDFIEEPKAPLGEEDMEYVQFIYDTQYIIRGWKSMEIKVVERDMLDNGDSKEEDMEGTSDAEQLELGKLEQID